MRKVLLIGLMVFAIEVPSASAQAHLMNKAEFELFLHDLDRDTARWMNVVSEVDVASLKDLPYQKGHLIDKAKGTLRTDLLAIRDDVTSLKNHVTLISQIDLLMDLEQAEDAMDGLACDLDIKNPEDMPKFTKWLNDVDNAYGEIINMAVTFYGHLRELSRRIDLQTDVSKIH